MKPGLKKITRAICDTFPNFDSRGRLVYEKLDRSILRAFYLNPCSNKDHPQYECFVIPLYIISEGIYFSFGHTVRVETTFEELNAPVNIDRVTSKLWEAYRQFLRPIESEKEFMDFLINRPFSIASVYSVAVIYTYFKMGAPVAYSGICNEAIRLLNKHKLRNLEVRDQVSIMLSSDDPRRIIEMLRANETTMKKRLGIQLG